MPDSAQSFSFSNFVGLSRDWESGEKEMDRGIQIHVQFVHVER